MDRLLRLGGCSVHRGWSFDAEEILPGECGYTVGGIDIQKYGTACLRMVLYKTVTRSDDCSPEDNAELKICPEPDWVQMKSAFCYCVCVFAFVCVYVCVCVCVWLSYWEASTCMLAWSSQDIWRSALINQLRMVTAHIAAVCSCTSWHAQSCTYTHTHTHTHTCTIPQHLAPVHPFPEP